MRRELGLTQIELAKKLGDLGWDRPNDMLVHKIEYGIRKLDTHELAILAAALDCEIADLFA